MSQIVIKTDHGTNGVTKTVEIPEYGEVRIVTHAGKITFIETTTKEKVE